VKRFLLWLAAAVVLFAGLGLGSHFYLTARPRRIVVAVDTSFSMQASQPEVRAILERIAATRYSSFSLLTDKLRVHGWQPSLAASQLLTYYGPRDLALLVDANRFPELAQADRVVVITDAADLTALRSLRALSVSRPR
jgi:hypothetical protein